jgi:type IV secretion system protein VirB9
MNRSSKLSLVCSLGLALSGVLTVAVAETTPTTTPTPSSTGTAIAVQPYEYQPDRIYTVRTGLGITTQIELSPNEKILDYSTGFSSGWDLTRRDNVFYIKPKNVDVDTNMMIRTATHSYILELKVVATDWKTLDQARRAGVQYKVSFTYPADTSFMSESKKVEETPELDTDLVKGRDYNFDYDYAKKRKTAPWLVPVNVYDDGRFTYIKMPDLKQFPTGNFPTVYMREKEHGEDSVVNTTVEGNTIVVHGTYNYLVIRHDDNVVGLRRNTKK